MSLENNSYLNTNLLHFRPVSAHLYSGIRGFGTLVHHNVSQKNLPGRVVCLAAKGVVYTGYLANSLVALVESTAFCAIGLTAAALHALTKGKSEILQKCTIKCLAYSMHSFLTFSTQAFLMYKRMLPEYQIITALHSHVHLILSALASQAILGAIFNPLAGRPQSKAALPNLLIESFPGLSRDVRSAMVSDFKSHVNGTHLANMPNIEQHRETVRNFTLSQLSNFEYRLQLINLVKDYLEFMGVAVPQGPGAGNNVILNSLGQDDKKYQTHLEKLIKETTIEIYQSKELAACFAEEGKEGDPVELGQSNLESFYGEIFVPLSNYTQLKELELENNACPALFNNRDLQQYKERKVQIDAVRTLLKELPKEHRDILVKKLLKGSSFDANKALENLSIENPLEPEALKIQQDIIKKAYFDISALATPLHQGKLMSQLTIDLSDFSPGSNNLFQGAVQAGMAEATKPNV